MFFHVFLEVKSLGKNAVKVQLNNDKVKNIFQEQLDKKLVNCESETIIKNLAVSETISEKETGLLFTLSPGD